MASKMSLRSDALSPMETFGQSVASVAPTATPAMIITQVYALSGNATWLAYLIATIGIGLVAANINQFAKTSSSPGSLYSFTDGVLPPLWSTLNAWALATAYVCTATALVGGLTSYANVFLRSCDLPGAPPALLTILALFSAGMLAYCDVTFSARLMLALEGVAIIMIAFIVGFTLYSHGFHLDRDQLALRGATSSSLRLGLVLAIFSSVGFESATSLGAEARNPLRSIPRAVILTAVCSGLFFTICAYAEVLGFRGVSQSLDRSPAPLHVLAVKTGLPFLGTLIDVSAVISFFSCALACITAAARILFHMGQKGDLSQMFGEAHRDNQTPHRAVVLATLLSTVPGVLLALRGAAGFDIDGWLGTVATFGFLTAYISVCVAAPFYLRSRNQLTVPAIAMSFFAICVMAVAFAGSVYPMPTAPYSYLPYIFVLLMTMGVAWSYAIRSRAHLSAAPSYPASESDCS